MLRPQIGQPPSLRRQHSKLSPVSQARTIGEHKLHMKIENPVMVGIDPLGIDVRATVEHT